MNTQQVYVLPLGADIEALRGLVGTEGSRLNPVEDADGNWVISEEEVASSEFAAFTELHDLVANVSMQTHRPKVEEIL